MRRGDFVRYLFPLRLLIKYNAICQNRKIRGGFLDLPTRNQQGRLRIRSGKLMCIILLSLRLLGWLVGLIS
jgi:hypothetical protein